MKTFKRYCEENLHIPFPENDTIDCEWFVEHRFPMIVACACCEMTMTLPSAMIDERGRCFCSNCAE